VQTLARARYFHRDAALQEINTLRERIGSGQDVERERAAAWLAISALYKSLHETPNSPVRDELWQRAIDETAAWHASLP
jgi:hypothetical protein